jgi:hypothetical protein
MRRATALRRALLAALILLCTPGPLFGQESREGKVVVIEHADSLVGLVVEGQRVRQLMGNVRISQGRVRLSCQRALQFLDRGDVELTGDVLVVDSNVTMRTSRAMFYREARRAEAFGDVRLDDGKVRVASRYGEYFIGPRRAFFRDRVEVQDAESFLESDSLMYESDARSSIATGDVRITLPAERTVIRGRRVEHFGARGYTRVTVDPLLLQTDRSPSGVAETLVVRSVVMEAFRDTARKFVATDSVRLVRSDLAARAGWAVFHAVGDSIVLRRSPVVWYGSTQITGDSIDVTMQERILRRAVVTGSAFAASQSDSLRKDRFDQLSGEVMTLGFEEGKLAGIVVERRSTSLYHLYEESRPNGANRASGDRIDIRFFAGDIASISVQGGVQGEYFPEPMVRDREGEYALPGFRWRGDRPSLADLTGHATGRP